MSDINSIVSITLTEGLMDSVSDGLSSAWGGVKKAFTSSPLAAPATNANWNRVSSPAALAYRQQALKQPINMAGNSMSMKAPVFNK